MYKRIREIKENESDIGIFCKYCGESLELFVDYSDPYIKYDKLTRRKTTVYPAWIACKKSELKKGILYPLEQFQSRTRCIQDGFNKDFHFHSQSQITIMENGIVINKDLERYKNMIATNKTNKISIYAEKIEKFYCKYCGIFNKKDVPYCIQCGAPK